MSGDCLYGKCEVCGKTGHMKITTFDYSTIKCECHSPHHFVRVQHCEFCTPKEPHTITIVFKTSNIRKMEATIRPDNTSKALKRLMDAMNNCEGE